MNSKVTYHQQVSYCGKPRCRKCREGTGHGPYWYAYQTIEGRTTRTYIGKHLPPEAQAAMEGQRDSPPSVSASEQEKALIRIYVLGQFRLERRSGRTTSDWETVTESAWQHQRVRALLGCLVSNSGRKLTREQITEAIWPDLDFETASSRLDRAVYSLRQLFEPSRNRPATSPFLLTEREVLVLAGQSDIWIDADAFEQLLTKASESDDPGEQERLLDEAATLYGGDFLPEERRIEWTLARRESLHRGWIGMLLDLADCRSSRNALTSAIEPLDRLLSVDPTNEAAVQRLIKLLAQLGRRGEALRAYKRLTSFLQQEYRIAPLPETRALYEALRSGGNTQAVSPTTASATAGARDETRRDMRSNAVLAVQIGRTHQSPLVGREEELKLLRDMVLATEQTARFRLSSQRRSPISALDAQRRPQCMLVMGDVGIGKTRLAEEVSRDARRRNWAVAWSRVYAQEGSIPYRLWTEILRKAMAHGAWQRQELSRRPVLFQPLCALLPELTEYLPAINYNSSQQPEQEQLRLWEAARELLLLISEGTPLLIALDDLQWADSSSCELLAYLARRIIGHSIVIVGTCRDNELPQNHALRPLLTDLQREHALETLSLQPLNDEQISKLVSHVSSHLPSISAPLVEGIRNRAAGNPFFAEELARTVVAHAASSNGSTTLHPTSNIADMNGEAILPDTITAVLDLRLGNLSQPCLRLLNKAAVLGGSFEFSVINQMEAITPGSNEDIVLDLLEEALKSGMLTEEGIGTRITYQFWHPLLVDHLYEKLSAARRASLHRRAAEIFQRFYDGRLEEGAATITHHLLNGGAAPAQVAHFAELAGNRAYALSSYAEAEKFYRITIDQLGARPADQQHYAYLLECLGECTRVQGKDEEARRFYEQALNVHTQHSSRENPQEIQIQALLLHEIGRMWYYTGDNMKCREYCERGEKILRDAGILTGVAWAKFYLLMSYVYWREGHYKDARTYALEALEMFEQAVEQKGNRESQLNSNSIRRTLVGDPVDVGRAYTFLGTIDVSAGHSGEALSHINMALTTFEQYDCAREIAIACCNLGDVHLRKAEYSQAQAALRRSLGLAERIGELPLVSFDLGNLGILAIRTGNLAEAESHFKEGIALAEHINDAASVSAWGTYLTSVLLDLGRITEAHQTLFNALRISRSLRIDPYIGLALVVVGNLRVVQAMMFEGEDHISSKKKLDALKRAKNTLSRALRLESIDAETRIEGALTLVQATLLLGDLSEAYQRALQTLEEARASELTWLTARAQRLLGSILVAQKQPDQGTQYFEQALKTFRKCNMRLEYARTLHEYGKMLVQAYKVGEKRYRQGLSFLTEAKQIFTDCKAALDLQIIERVLQDYEQPSQR
jgi:DNA-binding SARP family transcriptional activator/predicted negative regulator of RcsB-dependent stress response